MIAQTKRLMSFTRSMFFIVLLAVMSLIFARPAAAQQANVDTPTPVPPGASVTVTNPVAYRTPQGNVAVTSMAALVQSGAGKAPYDPGVTLTQDAAKGHSYDNLRWSPDGTNLLFTDSNSNVAYLAVSGQKPVQIASNLALNSPAAWAPDGTQIAVVVSTGQTSADGTVYQIQLLTLSGGAVSQPQFGASFVFGGNCGSGGTNDPAVALYSIETAPAGNTFSLDWTPTGFLHSIDCSGHGVGLTSLGEQNTDWTAPSISRVVASPDGTKAAGVVVAPGGDPYLQSGTLAVLDLRNGTVSQVTGETTVDRVAWSPDGKNLVYTTRAVGASFPLAAKAPAEARGIFNDLRGYGCGLWRVALGDPNAKPVELFRSDERDTYAFGLLQVSGDQSTIAMTSIVSDAEMVNALNQGASLKIAAQNAPYASILLIPWSGVSQSASTALLGGQPTIGKGSFTAIAAQNQQPAAGNSPTLAPVGNSQNQSSSAQNTTVAQGSQGGPGSGLNPAALSVGAQATVTVVAGGTLNMHPSPSATAPIVHTLNPGDKVIVLSPPQLAEGFRWWLVRAPDNSQGWAVDQIGSTVTLTLVSVIDTGNCLGHVGGTLHVGGTAMSKDHEALVSTPGQISTQNTVGSVEACDKLTIIGGPQVINGINWWQVQTVNGTVGWASERPLYAPGGPFLIIPID